MGFQVTLMWRGLIRSGYDVSDKKVRQRWVSFEVKRFGRESDWERIDETLQRKSRNFELKRQA